MEDSRFLEGVMPEAQFQREQCTMYTDGRLDQTPVVKGFGGVLFSPSSPLPFYFGDRIDPDFQRFDHIAPIKTETIRQALLVLSRLFDIKRAFSSWALLLPSGACSRRVRPLSSDIRVRRTATRLPLITASFLACRIR